MYVRMSVMMESVHGRGKLTLNEVDYDVQNGPPDGIAIVDTYAGTVLDALSDEGSITAANIIGLGIVSLVEGTALPAGVADSD